MKTVGLFTRLVMRLRRLDAASTVVVKEGFPSVREAFSEPKGNIMAIKL